MSRKASLRTHRTADGTGVPAVRGGPHAQHGTGEVGAHGVHVVGIIRRMNSIRPIGSGSHFR